MDEGTGHSVVIPASFSASVQHRIFLRFGPGTHRIGRRRHPNDIASPAFRSGMVVEVVSLPVLEDIAGFQQVIVPFALYSGHQDRIGTWDLDELLERAFRKHLCQPPQLMLHVYRLSCYYSPNFSKCKAFFARAKLGRSRSESAGM
ncbi:hypothetical protein ES703_124011 [subsurface metagenome]